MMPKGTRIRYAVTSGFCTQVYYGSVVLARKNKTLVAFDNGGRAVAASGCLVRLLIGYLKFE